LGPQQISSQQLGHKQISSTDMGHSQQKISSDRMNFRDTPGIRSIFYNNF
jgi:hypothetical protein